MPVYTSSKAVAEGKVEMKKKEEEKACTRCWPVTGDGEIVVILK
jgi:hypothetical protein